MFLLAFQLKHFSSWIELILSVHQFFLDNNQIQNHVFNIFIPELLCDVQIFQCLLYICASESILTLGTTHRLQIILWSVHLNAFLAQRVDLLRQVVYFVPWHSFRILQVFCHRIQVLLFGPFASPIHHPLQPIFVGNSLQCNQGGHSFPPQVNWFRL